MDVRLVRAGALMLLLLLQCASGSSQDRTIVKIAAERFTFTPSRLTVKRGTVIEFRLRSEDTNHGFKIIGSSANVIIPKRGRGHSRPLHVRVLEDVRRRPQLHARGDCR